MFTTARLSFLLGLILFTAHNAFVAAQAGVGIEVRKERLITGPDGTFNYDAALEQIAHDVK